MSQPTNVVHKVRNILSPFANFAKGQALSSVLLLLCTSIAIAWANSPYAHYYHDIFATTFGFQAGDFLFSMSLEAWISEGLMALFFFFLGLEIKREFLVGGLRKWQQSLPVIMGALGGMIFPAIFFITVTHGTQFQSTGWGIPMATDTAFALGILAFLHNRIPQAVSLFVIALAIIDDIGAMLIIAIAYTEEVVITPLIITGILTGLLVTANHLGIRKSWFYFSVGIGIWFALHQAKVHTTVAGILVALTIPAYPELSRRSFVKEARNLIKRFEAKVKSRKSNSVLSDTDQQAIVSKVEEKAEKASTPIGRLEFILERPITLIVMPLFALANAGIAITPEFIRESLNSPLAAGIFVGLVFGKSIGVVLMTQLTLWLGWGRLTQGLDYRHVIGIGLLAGIGFTMSLLIATLAYSGNEQALAIAKSSVLSTSLLAGIAAFCWLRFVVPKAK